MAYNVKVASDGTRFWGKDSSYVTIAFLLHLSGYHVQYNIFCDLRLCITCL